MTAAVPPGQLGESQPGGPRACEKRWCRPSAESLFDLSGGDGLLKLDLASTKVRSPQNPHRYKAVESRSSWYAPLPGPPSRRCIRCARALFCSCLELWLDDPADACMRKVDSDLQGKPTNTQTHAAANSQPGPLGAYGPFCKVACGKLYK